jgi:folate-dependent phosphoribosylglycinamide formyltransferase PurN
MIQLYNPDKGTMQVAGLMSGSGSNLQKIIDMELQLQEKNIHPYHVAVIFTDNAESNAVKIGRDYNIPVIVRDIKSFYKHHGKPLKDLELRAKFDEETVKALKPHNIVVAAYAGYMSIATKPLINAFLGINVHPADLSIKNSDGARKYTGDHAVRDAILAGEKYIRSSTHIIEDKVDYGQILIMSAPLAVILPHNFDASRPEIVKEVEQFNQNRLKERGDWIIFPKTLIEIANGNFSRDSSGIIFHNDKALFNGLKLEYSSDSYDISRK